MVSPKSNQSCKIGSQGEEPIVAAHFLTAYVGAAGQVWMPRLWVFHVRVGAFVAELILTSHDYMIRMPTCCNKVS